MQTLFASLSHAVEGTPFVAISASFLWGVFSVVLSPCHLTSIPLIIGYLSHQDKLSSKRVFLLSSFFAVGVLISIGLIGGITAAAGRLLGDVGQIGNYIVAAVFLVFGLYLLDILPLSWPGFGPLKAKNKNYISVFSLGLIFGLALGPCTFAFMAPMLGIVFQLSASNFLYGVILLSAFGFGHSTVIVAAGVSTKLIQRFMNWNEKSKGVSIIRKLCGILVLLGGFYLVYKSF